MNTVNKLHIKIRPSYSKDSILLILGKVRITTNRRSVQEVYKFLLTRTIVEGLAEYAYLNKHRDTARVYLNHYLNGHTIIISDKQLLNK